MAAVLRESQGGLGREGGQREGEVERVADGHSEGTSIGTGCLTRTISQVARTQDVLLTVPEAGVKVKVKA